MCVAGVTRDLNITGLWFWRGNTLAFERSPDWQIDYEVYDWVKVDWDSAEAKVWLKFECFKKVKKFLSFVKL